LYSGLYENVPVNGICAPLDVASEPEKASPAVVATEHVPAPVRVIATAPAPAVTVVAVSAGAHVTPP